MKNTLTWGKYDRRKMAIKAFMVASVQFITIIIVMAVIFTYLSTLPQL